jgi:hypothetical protein
VVEVLGFVGNADLDEFLHLDAFGVVGGRRAGAAGGPSGSR